MGDLIAHEVAYDDGTDFDVDSVVDDLFQKTRDGELEYYVEEVKEYDELQNELDELRKRIEEIEARQEEIQVGIEEELEPLARWVSATVDSQDPRIVPDERPIWSAVKKRKTQFTLSYVNDKRRRMARKEFWAYYGSEFEGEDLSVRPLYEKPFRGREFEAFLEDFHVEGEKILEMSEEKDFGDFYYADITLKAWYRKQASPKPTYRQTIKAFKRLWDSAVEDWKVRNVERLAGELSDLEREDLLQHVLDWFVEVERDPLPREQILALLD